MPEAGLNTQAQGTVNAEPLETPEKVAKPTRILADTFTARPGRHTGTSGGSKASLKAVLSL